MLRRFLYAKRRLLRALIHSCSFTGALFVFQACYGPPPGINDVVYINGKVKAARTQAPIQGIRISVDNNIQSDFTNNEGRFWFQVDIEKSHTLKFEDVDSSLYGSFNAKELILNPIGKDTTIEVTLDEK
jgi:hypothetical protein